MSEADRRIAEKQWGGCTVQNTRPHYDGTKTEHLKIWHEHEILAALAEARAEGEALYKSGCKVWGPVYQIVLQERDQLRQQLAEARAEAIAACARTLRNLAKTDHRCRDDDNYNAGWLDAAAWLEEEMKK